MVTWKGYQRGVNLGGWLSQCVYEKEHYETFIKEEDIKEIKSWGLDHVRVPVDYNLVQDERGNFIEDGFVYIQRAIDWCGKYGLNMVLDLHKTVGYSFDVGEKQVGFFDSEELQEIFYKLWEEFAKRYGKYHDRVAFELLNEVTSPEYSDAWNRVATTCKERIRAIDKEVYILIGGYWNNSIDALPDLDVKPDAHTVLNFHCYEPLVFTHQGAHWVPAIAGDFRIGIDVTSHYMYDVTQEHFCDMGQNLMEQPNPDAIFGAEYFLFFFKRAVDIAEKYGVGIYCGEYGVIDLVPTDDMMKWYRYIHEAFETYGIGRAAWSYREMNFGLSRPELAKVHDELITLL